MGVASDSHAWNIFDGFLYDTEWGVMMYRKVISLIATSVLLLFSVAASSPYIMGDGNTLTVTLPVDQIEFVNVIFIGDEQFVAAAESGSGNVIPVPGSDGLVLQASSLRSKEQLVPTFTGFFVDSFLENTFPVYIGYGFTSEMEKGLDKIASGDETKTAFLDRFWKGAEDFHGLKTDLESVQRTVRKSEVKSLSIPGLEYKFLHDGKSVGYSIRIGKFGPYIASDYTDESTGKLKMASIDQTKYFPGTFSDKDAENILFPADNAIKIADGIYQEEGRYGIYYRRESDGKTVRGLKDKKKLLSPELIELAFELPKSLGEDEEGNSVMLSFGPYGFYGTYMGKNYPVSDPLNADKSMIIEASAESGKKDFPVLKDYGVFEGEPLQLLDGRYGIFLRWGKKNCALSKEMKEKGVQLSEEEARKIASEAPEKKSRRYPRRQKARS